MEGQGSERDSALSVFLHLEADGIQRIVTLLSNPCTLSCSMPAVILKNRRAKQAGSTQPCRLSLYRSFGSGLTAASAHLTGPRGSSRVVTRFVLNFTQRYLQRDFSSAAIASICCASYTF